MHLQERTSCGGTFSWIGGIGFKCCGVCKKTICRPVSVLRCVKCMGLWGLHYFKGWFSLKWYSRLQLLPIAIKELIPVSLAAAIWGNHWSGKTVLFRVDNMAVVEAINASFCKDAHLMHLIWLLVFFAFHHSLWLYAAHVAGRDDKLADSLSRNNISAFLS